MIRFILNIYIVIIIVDAVLSFFPNLRSNQIVSQIRMVADLSQKPIRRFLPPDIPFDPSPLIVIVLIQVIMKIW